MVSIQYSMVMPRNKIGSDAKVRLTGEAWTSAAFDVFTHDGLQAISIESLAKQLGATRGSFYWHFESRDDLIDSVLAKWKQGATQAQQRLRDITDPRERLRIFLAEGIADLDYGRREIGLLSLMNNPRVRKVVEEHTIARTEFVEEALIEAGHDPADAHTEAIQSWALWIGAYQLATAMPDLVPGSSPQEKLAAATRSLLARVLEDPKL